MTLLAITLGVLTTLICGVLAFLTVELLTARTQEISVPAPCMPRPRFAVLIPAHNEEEGLAKTLHDVCAQLMPGDRCVVIADNCSDHTADVARPFPVEVLVRHHQTLRGKGHALAAGVAYLAADPPDVVLFVDADCEVIPGSLEELAEFAHQRQLPVQAGNDLLPPPDASIRDRISAFAFRLKNHVRASGLNRLGGAMLLFGTGMAIPWHILQKISLGSSDSVEDMQLGIELALRGWPVCFRQMPCVRGTLPASATAASSQRRRWEQGHLRTLVREVPRLVAAGVRQMRGDLLLLALDLAVPPLALLMALSLGLSLLHAIWGVWSGEWSFLLVHACFQATAGLALVRAWRIFARDLLGMKHLLSIPSYILWKAPIYLGALRRTQKTWQSN